MNTATLRILLIEDNPSDVLLLRTALDAEALSKFELTHVERLSDGLKQVMDADFDIVLADLGLPDSSGLETFVRLHNQAPNLPVVVFSGNDDKAQAIQAVRAGAQDYLVKGPSGFEMASRAIRYAIERNKLHSNLRESEQRFSTLFLSNPVPVGITRVSDYRIVDVNDAWISLTGYTRDEAIGHTSTELGLVKPEILQQVREKLRGQGEINQYEVSLYRRSGQERLVHVSSEPIQLGSETYILNSLLDITERRLAEDALKESEARFSKVFFNNPVSQSILSPTTGQVVEVNDACCSLYEYSREELIGTDPGTLNLWGNPADQVSAVEELQRTGRLLPREVTIRPKSGETRTILFSVEQIAWKRETCLITSSVDITERKKIEQALRASEENYRNLVENSESAIAVLDRQGRILYSNPRGIEIWQDPEIVGKTIFDVYSNEYANVYLHAIQSVIETGINILDEVKSPIRDRMMWFRISMTALKNLDGTVNSLMLNAWDITERRQAEEKLRESEERHRQIAGLISDYVYQGKVFADGTSETSWISGAFERITGYTLEEIKTLPQGFITLMYQEDLQSLFDSQEQFIRERSLTSEYRICRKDGNIRWIRDHMRIVAMNSEKNVLDIIGAAEDITERKQAEQAIKDSENRLKSMLDSAMDAIVSTDQDQRIVLFNGSAERMFGVSSKEALGQTINRFIPDRFHDYHHQQMQGLTPEIAQNIPPNKIFSIKGLRANGEEFPAESTISYVESNGEKLFTAILRDVTEQKKAEEALRKSEELYRSLAEASDAIIILLDTEGRIQYLNEKASELQSLKNAPGQTLYELFPQPAADLNLARIQKVISLGKSMVVETSVGDTFYRTSLQPVHDEQGRVVMVLVSATDITELKMAQQELLDLNRSLEERVKRRSAEVQDLYDNAPTGYHSLDIEGRFTQINQTELNWLGYTREELIGHSVLDILTPDSIEIFKQNFSRFKQTGSLRDLELEFIRKDRTTLPTLLNASAVHDDRGNFLLSRSTIFDNTERKKVERALRDSEEQNRLLFEESPDAAGLLDINGVYLRVNRAYENLTGLERGQILGKQSNTLNLIVPEEQERIHQAILESRARNEPYASIEYSIRHTSGMIRNVDARIFTVSMAGQIHVLYTLRDITERKKAEQAFIESEETYRALFENANDAIFLIDPQGTFLRVNSRCEDLLGYSIDEMVGHTAYEFIVPRQSQEAGNQLQHVLAGEHVPVYERSFSKKDGTEIETEINLSLIYDGNHQPKLIQSVVRDITKRKEAEQALRESQANLQNFLDTASDMIQSLDERGDFIYVNHAWCEALGYTSEEAAKLTLFHVVDPQFHDHCRATLQELLATGHPQQLEVIFRTKTGAAIVAEGSVSGRNIKDGQAVTNGIFRNITKRKQAEDSLQQANVELERALRMKDEFLASMSHELRTPLTGILGLSEALQYDTYGLLTPKQKSIIENIENNGRHLLELINDILDISKMEAGKLELEMRPCSLGEICQSSLQLVKGMAHKKGQSISFSMNPTSIVVKGDARRLTQILVNLLSNAVKYSPEKSPIGLEVTMNKATRTVMIDVWDKGVGIASEDMSRLFQPFVQLDSSLSRQQTGTGLGLALIHRLVDLHGGSLQVESVPGQGSRFTVMLPGLPDDRDIKEETSPLPIHVQQSLVVEDSTIDADRLTRFLKQLGIHSTIQMTGAEVIAKAAELQPGVILLDINLPDMTGWEVLEKLKQNEQTRSIPVIITSVVEDREKAHQLGADGYLLKLFTFDELHSALSRIQRPATSHNDTALVVSPQVHLGTVMIVDDNETNILMIEDYLRSKGYNVVSSRSAAEFLSNAPSVRPDLVLMDIQMPDIDGLEAIRRLRLFSDPRLASVPVIAITALAMPGDRERCLQAGANEYLSKPIHLKELLALTQRILMDQDDAHT